jgi:universal stress protein A
VSCDYHGRRVRLAHGQADCRFFDGQTRQIIGTGARNAQGLANAAELFTRRQLRVGQVKAQFTESDSVIDLVPQILHLKKILVPNDFSDPSKKAFQYARRLAEQFDSEIVLLHVIELPPPIAAIHLAYDARRSYQDQVTSAKKNLRALSSSTRSKRFPVVSSVIRTGHAPNEISKAAKDLDVDLIVIATHGYTSWRHLCLGSTTERVVRTAPCPVLAVREKEHEFI